jgi:hypothetical protein
MFLHKPDVSLYGFLMTIEQIVEIPASRRLFVEVPREIPAGRTILTFTPAPSVEDAKVSPRMTAGEAIEKCRGIAKGSRFTSRRLFEDRRGEAALDEAQYRRLLSKSGDAD